MTDGNTYAIERRLAEQEAYYEQQRLEERAKEADDLEDQVETLTAENADLKSKLALAIFTISFTRDALAELTGGKDE